MITTMLEKVTRRVSRLLNPPRLPLAALDEKRQDHRGLPEQTIDLQSAIDAAIIWLGQAQDHSLLRDGGVARHYSLLTGWSASYPETTGYIVPTMIEYARFRGGVAGVD